MSSASVAQTNRPPSGWVQVAAPPNFQNIDPTPDQRRQHPRVQGGRPGVIGRAFRGQYLPPWIIVQADPRHGGPQALQVQSRAAKLVFHRQVTPGDPANRRP